MVTKNILGNLSYEGFKTHKLVSNESGNVLLISLEKGSELKEHKSNTDASILILEGEVIFKINGTNYTLVSHDLYSFKKDNIHAIEAIQNSKLILIKS
ncbi:MAG: hypothetical protein CL840_00240 [Crocinitomicaceae bacterium]|nr:hypothetical protein [Crocinitomicaceae bacterium]|tara:strand:+ start:11397 stop:11690 length:294 start_codon:yes stop_codon:yes gene_type:complete